MILVSGGSGSGKSSYAEQCLVSSADKYPGIRRIYLATMQVYGEEGQKKVERHRQMRRDKDFETIEQQTNISEVCSSCSHSCILLEDLPNLVANEMYTTEGLASPQGYVSESTVIKKICREMDSLASAATELVVVTGNVFSDGFEYDIQTMAYINALGRINQYLAAKAEAIYELVCGIPICLKSKP